MSKTKKKGRGMFVFICILAFLVSFAGSAAFKVFYKSPALTKYTVNWSDEIGKAYTDFSYGEKPANKFDLYVPADNTKDTYGLIVYLHAGGFRTGDKSEDKAMLEWLCSLGYVTCLLYTSVTTWYLSTSASATPFHDQSDKPPPCKRMIVECARLPTSVKIIESSR